jgi:hypothetical protein
MKTESGSCVICHRPRPSGYITCGASYCQEARHYLNMARHLRQSSHAYREAMAHYEIALDKALEVADRRYRNEEAGK